MATIATSSLRESLENIVHGYSELPRIPTAKIRPGEEVICVVENLMARAAFSQMMNLRDTYELVIGSSSDNQRQGTLQDMCPMPEKIEMLERILVICIKEEFPQTGKLIWGEDMGIREDWQIVRFRKETA